MSKEGCSKKRILNLKSFPDIVDGKPMEMIPFLEAMSELNKLLEIMGKIFAPVRADLANNIVTLKSFTNSDYKFKSLEEIVVHVSFHKNSNPLMFNKFRHSLIALSKALNYIGRFLELHVNDYERGHKPNNLRPVFAQAYQETLRQDHNFIVEALVNMCLRAIPDRDKFHSSLLTNPNIDPTTVEAELMQEIKMYTFSVNRVAGRIRNVIRNIDPKYKSAANSPTHSQRNDDKEK